jgi:hypothetical protein
MNLEFFLEALVALLLIVTVGYCWQLNRRLAALRGAQGELGRLIEDFGRATRSAEQAIQELKRAGAESGQQLDERVRQARALCDELTVMTQAGNGLAERLERGASGRRPVEEDSPRPRAPRSESERELIAALRQAR